jgi:MFS family permease
MTVHSALFGLACAMAHGFVGAYLLKQGFGLPVALATYAAILVARFGLRFVALAAVRRVGMAGGMRLGAALSALSFLPLLGAENPAWLILWVACVSMAESLYWPVYHASTASVACGSSGFGRQVAERTMVGAIVSVIGPLAGGFLLASFGEGTGFGIAAAVCLLSTLPLGRMAPIDAGPIPCFRTSLQGDRRTMATFAADGWMASGLGYAWPMILFVSMGGSYEAFGLANAGAGLVGAVASIVCGRAVDRGQRDRYLVIVCAALALAFVLRAASAWSPLAALLANVSGAAIAGFYGPVVMSAVYERSKRSGAAYRAHIAAEAGWDVGAVSGLLAAAAVAALAPVASFAVLPASLGIVALYACVRSARPARAARVGDMLATTPAAA